MSSVQVSRESLGEREGVRPGGLRVVPERAVVGAEAALQRAEALYRHDRGRAVDEVRGLLEVEHSHAWRLLRAAKLLLSAGEAELASVALGRAAAVGRHRHRSFSADLSHARGLLAELERRHASAERHLRGAYAADPTYAVFAASVVEFLVRRGRGDEARAFADRVEPRLADRAYFVAVRRSLRI